MSSSSKPQHAFLHSGDGGSFRRISGIRISSRQRTAEQHLDDEGGSWWQEDDRLIVAAVTRIQAAWRRLQMHQRGGLFFVSEAQLQKMEERIRRYNKGFTGLVKYLLATSIFFTILVLQKDPASAYTVERALVDIILDVSLPNNAGSLYDVSSADDIFSWWEAFVEQAYDANEIYGPGNQEYHSCHVCATLPSDIYNDSVDKLKFECGTWQAQQRKYPGRCWDTDGNQRPNLTVAEAQFCEATCFPAAGTDCAWVDRYATENLPLPGASVSQLDAKTAPCGAHFCFSSCAKAGIVPEMPYAEDPTLTEKERLLAPQRRHELASFLDYFTVPGTRESPTLGIPLFDDVGDSAPCKVVAGKINRRWARGLTGGKVDMLSNGHDGERRTGWLGGTSSRVFGMMNVVQRRAARLERCAQVSGDALEEWYSTTHGTGHGRCYSQTAVDTEWADAGRYLHQATQRPGEWYPLNTSVPWVYAADADGYFKAIDLGSFDAGKQSQICTILNLKAAKWIDDATRRVDFRFITYNGNHGIYAVVDVSFEIEVGGYVEGRYEVDTIIRKQRYQSDTDFVRLALEVVFLCYLVHLTLKSSYECVCVLGARKFMRDGELVLDVISCMTWWLNVSIWVYICIDGENFKPPVSTHIGGLQGYYQMLGTQRDMMRISYVHTNVYGVTNSLSVFLSIIKIFVKLQFSERMSIITNTITMAAVELVHFIVLYVIVVLFYAFMGFLVFGSRVKGFRWFYRAILYVHALAFGGGDLAELEEVDSFVAKLYYWSFVVLVALLMLNILLAIAVESFDKQKEQSGCSDTFYGSMMLWLSLRRTPSTASASKQYESLRGKLQASPRRQKGGTGASTRHAEIVPPTAGGDLEAVLTSIDIGGDAAVDTDGGEHKHAEDEWEGASDADGDAESSESSGESSSVSLRTATARLEELGLRGYFFKKIMCELIEATNEEKHGPAVVASAPQDKRGLRRQAVEEKVQVMLSKALAACHELAPPGPGGARQAGPLLAAVQAAMDELGFPQQQ